MLPTPICIFARPMIRLALAVCVVLAAGCDDLDGRSSNRKGNRLFRDGLFKDAAAEFEQGYAKVKDDKIRYNLGLTYTKLFGGTPDGNVLIAEAGELPCLAIPGTVPTKRSVCVKREKDEEDRAYPDCSDDKGCPTNAYCKKDADLCQISNRQLADLAWLHIEPWIANQPPDEEVRKRDAELVEVLKKHEAERDKWSTEAEKYVGPDGEFTNPDLYEQAMTKHTLAEDEAKKVRKEIDENKLKLTMRQLMTTILVDSGQHEKALAYWENQLKAQPNDFEALGNLAGINLKSGNWRKAIEWYLITADKAPELSNKLSSYSSVGNVAWARLNSRTLTPDESVELADLGIGALQKASELAPKNLQFLRLQMSLYGFRSLAHGSSFAAAIDRASGQDLKGLVDVLSGKAPATEPPKPETPPKKPGG